MNIKRCPRCGIEKPIDEFGRNAAQPSGVQTYCRPCNKARRSTAECKARTAKSAKAWYDRNAELQRERALARYYVNPEPFRARQRKANRDPVEYERHKALTRERHGRIKAMVFGHYGERCACCGETNPGFLTIDHINGCDKETRKEHGLGSRFYGWLRKNGFPEGFQTLCYNCNLGRAKNGGICPHANLFSR